MPKRHRPAWSSIIAIATLVLSAPSTVAAQSAEATTVDFFRHSVYPTLVGLRCQECHNDNGVASDTLLEFPNLEANGQQVEAFGLALMRLVDVDTPESSPLLLKPTNRDEHSGGELIIPGSVEERVLRRWIGFLSELSEDERSAAEEKILASKQRQLVQLSVRRLTHSQYNNSVRDLLHDQTRPANHFPQEDFIRGFKNQSDGQTVSPILAEAYSKSAERLAAAAFRGGDHLGLLPRRSKSVDDEDCAHDFVRDFGLRAFRRPLADGEVESYVQLLLANAQTKNDFLAGTQTVVEAMLQSPNFLFRIERGSGNEFEQYERASRLSFFLWDTIPNAELLQAAAKGDLASEQQIAYWARRMLDDPRARTSMEEFLSQWLRFDRVLTATRHRRYRGFNSEVASAMVEETTRLFNYLVWQDHSFMDFYTADYTFLNGSLAEIYGIPGPKDEFTRVPYPTGSGRGGVLGHGSFLVATSKPAETSPTERGLFVRSQLLSQEVPAPPPGVTTALPEITDESPMTNRQRLAVHLNSDACAGCHRLIDPIGFGLEQYDPIGAFRDKLQIRSDDEPIELKLDTLATVQGIENSEFSTPRQLGEVIARSEAGQRAIVKQLFRYAFGRRETSNDSVHIEAMSEAFRNSGFQFRELILSIVTSDLFLQQSSN